MHIYHILKCITNIKMKKTEKSIHELMMKDSLDRISLIINKTPLKTEEATIILTEGYKLLNTLEDMRKSRDNWRNKYEELKNGK